MHRESPEKTLEENRAELRTSELKNYRIEIKFIGKPIYQFRVTDVSTKGASILIKEDSDFLDMIEVGQIVDVNFISPEGYDLSGMYRAKIKHITKLNDGRYKGHLLVGVSILEGLDQG